MKNYLRSIAIAWLVLTALPAQAHAAWPCDNGDWQWSWKVWEWGCDCDSGWETTPSFWVDACTTWEHPSCNESGNQHEYICTFSSSETSHSLNCNDVDESKRSAACWYYESYSWNFSGPADGWFYKACPRTHVCSAESFNFQSEDPHQVNPCFELEFTTNSLADRPCGSGGIQSY